jgi:hypothetical protein
VGDVLLRQAELGVGPERAEARVPELQRARHLQNKKK